jgi:hypothetical protein
MCAECEKFGAELRQFFNPEELSFLVSAGVNLAREFTEQRSKLTKEVPNKIVSGMDAGLATGLKKVLSALPPDVRGWMLQTLGNAGVKIELACATSHHKDFPGFALTIVPQQKDAEC